MFRLFLLWTLIAALQSPGLPTLTRVEETAEKKAEIKKKLEKKVTIRLPDANANTPLKDMLEFLADRYEFDIMIDDGAFQAEGLKEVETQPITLPKQENVPLGKVLQVVLDQIPVKATYVIKNDYVLIVPAEKEKKDKKD